MNYTEFSKKIKEKYPYYNKVDDKVLAEKMIAKYPYYKDKVTFDIEEQPEGNSVKITDVFKNMLTPVTKPVETLTDTSVKIENTAEESVKPATQAISETVKNLNPIEQTKDIVNSATVKPYRNVEPSLRARTEEDDNSKVIYEPDSFDILGEQIAVASASDKGATSTKDLENIRKKQNMAIMTAGVVPFVAGGQMSVGGLAILEGIQQAKNYVSSKIQGKDYDFMAYENLSSLLPDNTPSVVRVVSSLAEMVADCVVAGRLETAGRNFLINEAVTRLETKMKGAGYTDEQVKTASNNLKKEIVQRETGLKEENGQVVQTEQKPINIDDAVKLNVDVERLKVPKAEQPKETIKADVEVEPITEPKQIKPVEPKAEVKVEEVKPNEEIKAETSIEPSKTKGNAKVVDKSINLERVAKILPQKSYEMDNEESLYRQTIYNTLIKDDVFTNGKVVIIDKDVAKKANEIAKNTVIEEFAKKQKGSKATKTKKATELYEEITKNTPTLYTKTIPDIKALIKKGSDGSEKTIIIDTEDEGRWSILGDNKTVINTGIYNAVQKEFNNELEIFLNKNKDVALLKDKNGNIKAILPASKTKIEGKKEELNRTIKVLEENIEGLNEEREYNLKHNYSTSVLDLNIKDTQEKLAKTKKELEELQKAEGTEWVKFKGKYYPKGTKYSQAGKTFSYVGDGSKIEQYNPDIANMIGKEKLQEIIDLGYRLESKDNIHRFTNGTNEFDIRWKDEEIDRALKGIVATVKGDEIVSDYTNFTNKEKRKQIIDSVKEWFRKYFVNAKENYAEREDLGKIYFYMSSIKEITGNGITENKIKVLPAVREIIEKGKIVGEKDVSKENRKDKIVKFYFIQANVELDGKPRTIQVDVAEDRAGKKFYYITDRTEKTPDSLTATQRRGVSGATNNIAQNQENGNNNLATSKTDFSQQTDVELPKVTKIHDELIKKSEIIRDLAKETDLPVKIGGTQRKNILGLYYMKEELVRLQVANDMLTLAHEIGHHEEKVLFGGVYRKYKDFTPEEKEFYKELKPLATKPAGNETRGKMFSEGMAQFISMFVNNPEQAQKVAPKFYEYFTKNAPEKTPKVYNALVKAQTRMSKYYTQNNINKVKNHISFERETEKLTPKEWFDKKLTQARTQLFDRLEPLRKSVQEIYKRAGLNISDTDPNNPYFIARLNSGSVGRAETFIKKHTYDFNTLQKTGKGFQTIIQEVEKNGGNLEDFATYLVAHDTIELAPRGIKTGVELDDAIKTIEQLEPIYGNYAKDLYQYRLSLLKMLKDGQIISPEAYNNIVNKSERYAPLQRVLDDEVNTMAGNKNFKSSNPLKNIKGSGRDIINPLETIVNETYNIINLVEKNRVGLALSKLANLDRAGAFIFKRPHKVKKVRLLDGREELTTDNDIVKNNEIKVFENGKPVVYEVAPEIAKIVNGLTIENQILYTRWLENVATIPARMLKFGATDVNLAFAFKNILRDLPLALVSSENKFSEITKSVLNMTVLGLKAMVNEKSRAEWNDIVDLYTKSGAGQSLLINDNRDTTIKAIDDLRYTGYLDKIWNKVKEKDFIEATKTGIIGTTELVRSIVGFLEQVPRLAEFVASLKGKPLTKENIEKAGFNARKITLDFASGGSFSKYVNKYVPYTNAFFLGIDKLKEVFKDEKQFKRLLGMLGVYAMACILGKVLDADSEEVDDVNRTQKYTNFVFKIGDTIFRIPKTIELAPFYTTIDTAISFVADTIKGKKKENAEYIRDIVGSMKANLFPNVIAQAVKLPIELYANKSMFFGTPIVSAELEKALPEYQYTEYTTELSKFIAKTLGNIGINKGFIADTIGSPQRLEYIVNSLAGNTGKYLFEKVDQIGRLTGVLPNKEYELPEKTLADIPFARAFVIRYPQQSRTIEDFYEKYKELKQYSNSFRLSKKRADIQAIQELAIYKSVDKVDKITKTMGDIRKTILTVYTDKNMSKDEKRQNIDELMLMRLALAKQGLNMMKEIEQNIKGEL